MPRKPSPRTLASTFLLVSAAISLAILAVRNPFDDEILSFDSVFHSLRTIVTISAQGDVHPPGMYLLAHLAYRILPSLRWINFFPGLFLYAGLAVFLFAVTPLFASTRARLCLLLLATLHPQLLMWGVTIRWYGWWTGLALITLTLALQPHKPGPTLSTARALTLALLLAALFYLNYITVLFLLALAPAVYLRYRTQPWKPTLLRSVLALTVFAVLIAPQLPILISVHLHGSRAQRYSLPDSVLRLLGSIAASETYLPWHPLAIASTLVFLALAILAARTLLRRRSHRRCVHSSPDRHEPLLSTQPLASILLFAAIFFLLVALSGLGGKPRNGLLLIPTLAPAAALLFESSPLALRPRLQTALLGFFALWSAVGIAHLLGRYGLAKSTMNDRPGQVIAFVRQASALDTPQPACSVVVTYDAILAFSLAQAHLPHTLIVSPYRGPTFGGARTLPTQDCPRTRLYLVHSYLEGVATPFYNAQMRAAGKFFLAPPQITPLDRDPSAAAERRLARLTPFGINLAAAASLPDYRYVITSGPIRIADLQAMRRQMPLFLSGYLLSVDEPAP